MKRNTCWIHHSFDSKTTIIYECFVTQINIHTIYIYSCMDICQYHLFTNLDIYEYIYIYISGVRLMKVKSGVLFFNKNMCT